MNFDSEGNPPPPPPADPFYYFVDDDECMFARQNTWDLMDALAEAGVITKDDVKHCENDKSNGDTPITAEFMMEKFCRLLRQKVRLPEFHNAWKSLDDPRITVDRWLSELNIWNAFKPEPYLQARQRYTLIIEQMRKGFRGCCQQIARESRDEWLGESSCKIVPLK